MNNIDITLRIMAKLQSVLHDIDELSHTAIYKQTFKSRTENYYSWLSKQVESITSECDIKESQQYIDIVTQFDKLGNTITVHQDTEPFITFDDNDLK